MDRIHDRSKAIEASTLTITPSSRFK